jgi:hypothetical protein
MLDSRRLWLQASLFTVPCSPLGIEGAGLWLMGQEGESDLFRMVDAKPLENPINGTFEVSCDVLVPQLKWFGVCVVKEASLALAAL